ncbi:translin-associated factor X-interacting protein 1-like [Rhopilema esculentum]|uniref:translin-associated factor X-interacting protein 1-like n=1 Tax=Rhopilema esculentum TaxID=499914 RepID=UPI0031CE85CC|eukprot:gene1715-16197_t
MTSARLPFIPKSPGSLNIVSKLSENQDGSMGRKDDKQAVFKLTSTGSTYRLPNPKNLKPYVDSETGAIDAWPAHAAKQPLVRLTTGDQNSKEPSKPKFLDRLEKFLMKELKALDCADSDKPSEKRLQAFREVFEYLINDFKTYRPLLSLIKNEYEKLIEHQREKIRELEPLQSLIVTISERCDKKLMSIKQDELGEIASLKVENDDLKKTIVKMRGDEVDLNEQVKKLQDEIAIEYRKYRDECDARKLLIQDLNDLKYQQDEAKKALLGKQDETGGDDVTMLKIALKKAREDLEAKTQKLAEVLADFGDVVPRRDFERLDAQFKTQTEEKEDVDKNYRLLMDEHSALISVHKKIVEQRDHLAQECEEMRRSATPRPDWNKCEKYVEGGAERWKELAKDKSSNELVDTLLAEMTGQDIAIIQAGVGAANEFFSGLGTGPDVPRYLRCGGEVVNRRIGKRDCAMLIKDIWKERVEHLKERPEKEVEDFDEFVFSVLKLRFGTEALAYEWGYNLHDACSRYNHEPRIGLFFSILGGEADEKLYHDQLSTFEKLAKEISSKSEGSDTISLEDLKTTLKGYFPSKDDESIETLINESIKDNENNTSNFQIKNLFAEDDEGNYGAFLNKIEEQDKAERFLYIKELEEKLGDEPTPSFDEVRQAFLAINPGISEATCQLYLQRGFGLSADKLKANLKVEKNALLKNLRSGSIRRV